MTARISLAGLQQRPADAAAGEPRIDREGIDAHRARPLAQRDQSIARQFVVDGRRDHRPVRRAQEFAQ